MDSQKLKLAIVKALAYTENNGKPKVNNLKAGQSGELKSIFQFLPATWKADSKKVTGQDNLPLTPQNEAAVVMGTISPIVDAGLKAGKSPEQIATEIGSYWNSGSTQGASKGLIGTNKSGVNYNVPAYAKKVSDYTDKFLADTQTPPPPSTGEDPSTATQKIQQFVDHIKQVNPQAIAETTNPLGNVQTAPQLQNTQPSPKLNQGMINQQPAPVGTNPGMIS
jgi:hypothetical protein